MHQGQQDPGPSGTSTATDDEVTAEGPEARSTLGWIAAMTVQRINWRAWLADWAVVIALGLVILAVVFLMSLASL